MTHVIKSVKVPCPRFITTDHSVWVIDFGLMEFRRLPRQVYSRKVTSVPYDKMDWIPFVSYMQNRDLEDGRVRFTVALSKDWGDWITSTYDPKEQ